MKFSAAERSTGLGQEGLLYSHSRALYFGGMWQGEPRALLTGGVIAIDTPGGVWPQASDSVSWASTQPPPWQRLEPGHGRTEEVGLGASSARGARRSAVVAFVCKEYRILGGCG